MKEPLYCSFCGESQHECKKLIAGPTVFICNECVMHCIKVLLNRGYTTNDSFSVKNLLDNLNINPDKGTSKDILEDPFAVILRKIVEKKIHLTNQTNTERGQRTELLQIKE